MSEQHIELQASEMIFREGDVGDALYVITSGRVQIYYEDPEQPVIIANLGAGEFFGEMALVDDQPRNASAVTLEPTILLRYQPEGLADLVTSHPGIGVRIIELMAQRLRKMDLVFRQAVNDLRG